MRFIIVLLVVFLTVATNVFCEDYSTLNIFAGTNSEDVKVHFVVADPLGKKTGYNPLLTNSVAFPTIANVNEIIGASYSTTRMASEDEYGNVDVENESIEFYVRPNIRGMYTITFYGISDTSFRYNLSVHDSNNAYNGPKETEFFGYISSGTTMEYKIYVDPTPGAPAPTIIKEVTFQLLRDDVNVAYKLNQLGDDKFVDSLIRMINLAEKLSIKCDKPKGHGKSKGHNKKDKVCKPAIAVLNMFIKRLEIASRKCDKPQDCDEEPAWLAFRKEHGKDKNFKDFFKEWDKDKWHKWKNKCKRFITDEALNIIRGDAEILIQDLGGKTKPDKKEKKTKNDKHD
ncbi:hypothetical protein KJ656_04300 [bacterium]|nr:hypothetical protein [bacterium]